MVAIADGTRRVSIAMCTIPHSPLKLSTFPDAQRWLDAWTRLFLVK
jgi:hypothetical protein